MYFFPDLKLICSLSSSNCCFLTCIQISQEAGQVIWYSHLFQNFPQFFVIHTCKGFGTVNKAEIDFFWNSFAFWMIQWMLTIWSLVPLPFLNLAWTSGSSWFHILLKPGLENFEHYLLACEMSAIVRQFEHSLTHLSLDWKENWPFPTHGHCWVFQI